MVRHVVTSKRTAGTAIAALAVGGAALVWHLLACIESPMAYSPDGQDLAFVTMQPYDSGDEPLLAGKHAYRLMVLHGEKELRTLEETTAEMLSAPAFSPDGKHVCYLRIPLLEKPALERLKKEVERRKEALNSVAPAVWRPETAGATSAPSSAPVLPDANIGLPSMPAMLELWENVHAFPALPAQLVVRDVKGGRPVSTTSLEAPALSEEGVFLAYLTTRPQFSPDGQWVYLCVAGEVLRVNPATSQIELVVAPAASATLSPDGKVLATFQENAVGLIHTDGQTSLYKRAKSLKSLAGLAWTGTGTLVTMESAESGPGIVLRFLDERGATLRSVPVDLPEREEDDATKEGMLAIAPDGRHAVVGFGTDVYFISTDGKLLQTWHSAEDLLAQPTFSPDGQRVAFKFLSKEAKGVTTIVFFTPEGREVTRVPIPPINPAATQASQP